MINYSLLDEAYPNDNKLQKKKKKVENETCKPLQAPPYIAPMACEVNNDKIIEASMENGFNKSDYKKDGIKSFDYDEMDAYLHITNDKKEDFKISKTYNSEL